MTLSTAHSTPGEKRYPNPHAASPLIECPVHGCVVVLGDDGRIKTCCPMCLREAKAAIRKMRKR